MDKGNLIDCELIRKVKLGDRSAFELLFKAFYPMLLRFSIVYLKQTAIAEEVVQELFLKVWENRLLLDETKSIKSYLYRCTHNQCLNCLKKLRSDQKLSENYLNDLIIRTELIEDETLFEYFDELAQENLIFKIKRSIDELPLQCKEVFLLCRLEGLTYQQIAEKLGISINTVKTQLARAIQKIRSGL